MKAKPFLVVHHPGPDPLVQPGAARSTRHRARSRIGHALNYTNLNQPRTEVSPSRLLA